MRTKLHALAFVAPLLLLASACSSAVTEPTILRPLEEPKTMIATTCNGSTCEQDLPAGYINTDSYPYVDTHVQADADIRNFGDIPAGSAALSATYDPPPDCKEWTSASYDPFGPAPTFDPISGQTTNVDYYGNRSAGCPGGPCYSEFLAARTAYRFMMGAYYGGGIIAAVSIVDPKTQFVYRVVRTVGTFAGTAGVVGWANAANYQEKKYNLDQCMFGPKGGGYYSYHVTVIK